MRGECAQATGFYSIVGAVTLYGGRRCIIMLARDYRT